MIVRATRKLLNISRIAAKAKESAVVNNLNEWYATLASTTFKGKQFVIFVHAPSLLAVVTEGKSLAKNLPHFKARLQKLLLRSNFPSGLINDMLATTNELEITTTKSKSVLAAINQLVADIEDFCLTKTDYSDIDLTALENYSLDFIRTKGKVSYTTLSWWNNYINGDDPMNDVVKNPPAKLIITASQINDDGLTREEELHMENQMLKMDLEQKMGKPIDLNLASEGIPELPLAVENLFLKQVSLFENQMRTAKEVSVFELIGKPKIKPLNTLKTPAAIFKELERLQNLLEKHNVVVDFLAEYEPNIIYNFLVDEIMPKMVPDLHVPGFISHFIYEEFHPNHELGISLKIKLFMNHVFNPEFDQEYFNFLLPDNSQFCLNNQQVSTEQFIETLKTYHLTHDSELVLGFDTKDLSMNEENGIAHASGTIVFKNEVKGKRKVHKPFSMQLVFIDKVNWAITHFNFDDLAF